jgi:hypothetical protein
MNTKQKKHLRQLAATLLCAAGIMYLLPVFADPGHGIAVPLFLLGVMSLIISGMLVFDARKAPVLGIVIPLMGILTGFLAIGAQHWDVLMTVMFTINAVVVFLCVMLVSGRGRISMVGQRPEMPGHGNL